MSENISMDAVRVLLEDAEKSGLLAKGVTVDALLSEVVSANARAAAEKVCAAKGIENVSDVVAFLFSFASDVEAIIPVTAGDPNGGNKNTRADRHMIEVSTPNGRLQVHLYRD